MCTLPLLSRVCRESYTDSESLYETLKRQGMDLVTVTDHDSIGSSEVLRRHPDFFVSVEVTCKAPSGTELHVAVYDVSDRQHLELQRRREDLEALVAYTKEQDLIACVNHAFSGLTGARKLEDYEVLANLFSAAEVRNGALPHRSNRGASVWARRLGLSHIGGSDAHTLRGAGKTYTEVAAARNTEEFLAGVRARLSRARGESGSWWKLTRVVLGIGASMAVENPLTLPLAPLAIVVPLVTAANYAYETTFAAWWMKRVAHSYRIAWSGSDLEARIAGPAHASRAAHTSTPPATTMVAGS
jgi:predicted metal-dependent phosphoesterase TrpH